MIRYVLSIVVMTAAVCSEISAQSSSFVSVKDQSLRLEGRAYNFIGTNYWYGSLLGLEKDKKRGVERLRKELDFLKRNGVTNLRLMGGAEGSGLINGVERVGPALQPVLGKFDEHSLDGLDLVLAEMSKRRMKAVIFFSNNWEWTGGFLQYVIWREVVPVEMRTRKLPWDELRDMGARFYVCSECKSDYLKQVAFVLDRTNKITGVKYTDDPTIMAWEIANEPRPMRPGANQLYTRFIRDAAAEIKSRDKNHLLTIGHEGSIGTESIELFEEVHRDPNIDYLTIHVWPKNWGWLDNAVEKSVAYIKDHIVVARRLNKPLVIEEFGLPRDAENSSPPRRGDAERSTFSFAPGSPTSRRDEYFRKIFSYVGEDPVAGANFWAFGGTARPIDGQVFWKAGDEWMGDPPMEEQGLNSVFDADSTTWRIIQTALRSLKNKK